MPSNKVTLRGNDNAVKHGGYRQLRHLDKRSREFKILNEIEAALVGALGGDPSPQEILLVQRARVKAFRCAALEHEIITKGGNVAGTLSRDYLRWLRSSLVIDLRVMELNSDSSVVPITANVAPSASATERILSSTSPSS